MDTELRERFRAKWKADVDAYYEARKRELDLEHQKALEEIEGFWFGSSDGNGLPRQIPAESSVAVPPSDTAASPDSSDAGSTAAGLPSGMTRRRVVFEQVLPALDDTFTVPDIVREYLRRYPEAHTPNLRHDITRMLRRETEKDVLALVKRAEAFGEKNVYQLKKERREGTLY